MKHGTLSAYRSGCRCDRCVAHVVRRCVLCSGAVILVGSGRPPKFCLRCQPEKKRAYQRAYREKKRAYRDQHKDDEIAEKKRQSPSQKALERESRVTLMCECAYEVHQISHLVEHTRSVHGRFPTRSERTPSATRGRAPADSGGCGVCGTTLRPRFSETPEDALERHLKDRPMCRIRRGGAA